MERDDLFVNDSHELLKQFGREIDYHPIFPPVKPRVRGCY